METKLKVEGMKCGACVNHVTKALQSVAGVQSADGNLATGAALVQHDQSTGAARLIEVVAEAGYQAHRTWDANAKA